MACIASAFAAASQGAAVAALPSLGQFGSSPAAEAEGAEAAHRVFNLIAKEAVERGKGLDQFDPQVQTELMVLVLIRSTIRWFLDTLTMHCAFRNLFTFW